MKRAGTKKNSVERRKKPRSSSHKPKAASGRSSASTASTPSTSRTRSAPPRARTAPASRAATGAVSAHSSLETVQPGRTPRTDEDTCHHCAKDLGGDERALFVEEEIGRIFCSEACITAYFAPEIERLEKAYLKRVTPSDLSAEEREGFSHLRWITLQEADEVWREKTLSGDNRYTLISEFQPGSKRIWCVCITLFLRGEPSFLYIAFTTKSAALVNAYRRGERVQWERKPASRKDRAATSDGADLDAEDHAEASAQAAGAEDGEEEEGAAGRLGAMGDRLAGAWTEDETFLAQMTRERSQEDIPPEEFELFQSCLEETLETPDEVWSLEMADPEGVHLYHFIREYPTESPGYWYVIVARETENEEQIEILDAFPSRDVNLVDRYRRGVQEVGESVESRPASRLVH